jgi:hypothetical protein
MATIEAATPGRPSALKALNDPRVTAGFRRIRRPRALFGRLARPANPDHFSASFEPEDGRRRHPLAAKPRQNGKKTGIRAEQCGVVAAPSQLRTNHAPALPRSNQNEATLFECCRSRQ